MGKFGWKLLQLVLLALIAFAMVMVMAIDRNEEYDRYQIQAAVYGDGEGSLRSYQCGSQCNRRCGRTQYKKPCLFFCNKCCAKCLCVPPGYYGNKGACGSCYTNWKTKRGGPKCP